MTPRPDDTRTPGRWDRAAARALELLGPIGAGELVDLDIAHQEGCLRDGGGPCTCRPVVTARKLTYGAVLLNVVTVTLASLT
jgi:hypothetical protein